jgi:hypothetical protein
MRGRGYVSDRTDEKTTNVVRLNAGVEMGLSMLTHLSNVMEVDKHNVA